MVPCTAMIRPLKVMAYGGGGRTGSVGVAGSGAGLHPSVSQSEGDGTEAWGRGGFSALQYVTIVVATRPHRIAARQGGRAPWSE